MSLHRIRLPEAHIHVTDGCWVNEGNRKPVYCPLPHFLPPQLNEMIAQILEVSLLGVGTVFRLGRDEW